jgi:putative addiction module component (TIGR02574 family)
MTVAAQKQVVEKALALPKKARAQLAHQLWESLEPVAEKISRKEWNQAWKAELEKRIADVDSGKVKCIPYAEARKRWNKILGRT